MGRRSSSSSSPSRSRLFASKPASKPAQPPAPVHNSAPRAAPSAAPAPIAQPNNGTGGGLLSGLVGTVIQGVAFGTGSSIAHRAVDAVAGPRQVEHVHVDGAGAPVASQTSQASAACAFEKNEFEQCVQTNGGNLDFCRSYFDALAQCQRSI